MKTAGIIAEYNPFHNGHQFHIEETRRRTGADYIIAVMSGDFVQRGAPALLNKYVRAEMALRHGADLVIELPITAALSSAEGFAMGGVCLLDKLNVTDAVSCGCENASEDTALFQKIVRLLADEPEEYRTLLRAHTKAGVAFPRARELAVSEYFQSIHPDLLSSPNNILAIEYAKAIHTLSDSMKLCLIPRKGGAYHDTHMSEEFSSATAIRRLLLGICRRRYQSHTERPGTANRPNQTKSSDGLHTSYNTNDLTDTLRRQVPSCVFDILQDAAVHRQCLCENDFSGLLFYSLIQRNDHLDDYCPAGSDLACRIRNSMEAFTDWQEFALLAKSRNRTYTAVSRCLAHILLDLTEDDFAISAEYGHAPYARVLGFRRDAAPLLKAIQAQADIPLLLHPAKDLSRLDEKQTQLLKKNVQASEIYKHILYQQSGLRLKSEFRQPLIIL
ncbi:MAG: nucleotidyltransferase family protein [Clostridiales bacterium]|nr:nucleotidyltransferase family protein [Clostridiales bacterium]